MKSITFFVTVFFNGFKGVFMNDIHSQTEAIERSLSRRKNIFNLLDKALTEAPEEMEILLIAISKAYYSGNIFRFWDVLAGLAGAERGYGNDYFFTALEIQKQKKNQRGENK